MTDTLAPPEAAPSAPAPRPRRRYGSPIAEFVAWIRMYTDMAVRWLTALVLTIVAVVPIVGNQGRVQDVDPMFMRTIIERMDRFGGTIYENGIYNKGWLEGLVYNIANHITSYDGFWYAISLFVAIAAVVIGYAGARTAELTGANKSVALAVAAVTYVHFTLSGSDYARVLYSRNLTVALLAGVWIISLSARAWATPRAALVSAIAVGFLLGFATQALTTTVFVGAAVGLVAVGLLYERRGAAELRRLAPWAVGSAVIAFVAAPIYYLARGRFAEFWVSWWTHAKYMSIGTGRPLSSQFALGWDQFYDYYHQRPLAFVLVMAFAATTWVMWPFLERASRYVHLGLLGWFAGAWLELILSQRYSSHYFSVLAVPTALMGAALAGHATRAVAERRPNTRFSLALPLVATLLAIYLTGASVFEESVKQTSRFTSIEAAAAEHDRNQGGGDRSINAILDLVSGHNDPLLAWTIDPTVYLKYERVPATRFSWKSFLLGEIYLGRTSPDYVLPHTWKWFQDDIEESDPAVFVETEDFTSGTPFEELIRNDFTEVYEGGAGKVWLRNDLAETVLAGETDRDWSDPGNRVEGSGWHVEDNGANFNEGGVGKADDKLVLADGVCYQIAGQADVIPSGELTNIAFHFDDLDHPEQEKVFLTLEGGTAGSGSAGLGPTGFESMDSGVGGDGPVDFAVVVAKNSAALIVKGELKAAVRLPGDNMRMSLESRSGSLELKDLELGLPPEGGGC